MYVPALGLGVYVRLKDVCCVDDHPNTLLATDDEHLCVMCTVTSREWSGGRGGVRGKNMRIPYTVHTTNHVIGRIILGTSTVRVRVRAAH